MHFHKIVSSFTKPLKYKPTGKSRKFLFGLINRPEYEILEEFDYSVGSLEEPLFVITVPKGFITDFASVPYPLFRFFKPTGKHTKASVIHDYLYYEYKYNRGKIFSKVVADAIFFEAMLVSKVNFYLALSFYLSVRLTNSWR